MNTHTVAVVERLLRKAMLPVCVASGAFVVLGFFFPSLVGDAIAGEVWLVLALVFFGTALAYVALLPGRSTGLADADSPSAPYLLRIRHLTLRESAAGFLRRQDPVTFGLPVLALGLFFAARLLAPAATGSVVAGLRDFVLYRFDWLFLGTVFLSVLYGLFLLVGPWGEVRLGGPDATPTYTYPTYFTLVFTAGIAAGIVFWGPAEAVFHYGSPPPFVDAEPASEEAIVGALTYALFHWGVSAWSAYLVIGLPIAYFVFHRGAPLRVSTILAPFLGVDRLDGPLGKLVDALAVVATIGGVATSVAFVSRQFLAGIGFQWGVSFGGVGTLLFVAGLGVVYVLSAESGIERGIRRIAAINVGLFGLFGLLLLAVGPRSFVLEQGPVATGRYVADFVPMSLFRGPDWVANWTVWNWSWWFSWAPFAGLFLAALSRGRRIRTVVLTAVVATSAASAAWFLLLGGTSLYLQHTGAADILGTMERAGGSEAVAGFPIFAALPLAELLTFLFLGLIVVFMVTSADTSTLVVSILASRRDLAPSTGSIVFWGVLQGAVAMTVVLVGGGASLQAIAVLTGGPFAVLALVAIVGLSVTLHREERGNPSLVGKLRGGLAERGLALPAEMPSVRDEE